MSTTGDPNFHPPADLFRLLGPATTPNQQPAPRILVYLTEFSDAYAKLNHHREQFVKHHDIAHLSDYAAHLDHDGIRLLALRLNVTSTSSATSFPLQEFLAQHFSPTPGFPIEPSNSWAQWLSLGAELTAYPLWQYLTNHKPHGDLETLTIVSPAGYVLYSILGNTALFTPTEAVCASTGTIFQLSSNLATITECSICLPVTETEVLSCLHRIFVDMPDAPVNTNLSSTSQQPNSSTKIESQLSEPPLKSTKLTNKKPKLTNAYEAMEIEAADDTHHVNTTNNADDVQGELDTEMTENNLRDMETDVTDSAHHPATPTSPLNSYTGPTDAPIRSNCVVISGFHKSIGSNGEIAKVTHALLRPSKILTSESQIKIKPEFHSNSNVCGFYPLELSESHTFSRYPQSSDEKFMFQQLKSPTNDAHNYHHVMAYAVQVSAQVFRTARTIGAFRGVIPNSNFIPLQIQQLHDKVFHNDPNIILFPNIFGTNIAGTHDAKFLHEITIMVKSLHAISTSDVIQRYGLHHNNNTNIFPVPLLFFGNISSMPSHLKTRPNLSLPSSVIIRSAEATTSFDVLSTIAQLKADPSLPWEDIAAILPMDLTSKSARAIEISYLNWHPTDHVVIIHKDSSDQRQLQRAISNHLQAHAMHDLLAKNERHLPGYLDRIFRKYAGINPPPPSNPTHTWMASSTNNAKSFGPGITPRFDPKGASHTNGANRLVIATGTSTPGSGHSWASIARSKLSTPATTISPSHPSENGVPTSRHTSFAKPPTVSSPFKSANTPAPNAHTAALEAIIAQQTTIIAQQSTILEAIEQRLRTLEAQSNHANQIQLIDAAVSSAVTQIATRFEATITQLFNSLNERKGGSHTPPQNGELVRATPLSSCSEQHLVSRNNWISESQLLTALSTWCPSTPIISIPLITQSTSFSPESLTALQTAINLNSNKDVIGVIFAGGRHWQAMVISPTSSSVTFWDVQGPLQRLSQRALMTALPGWNTISETLPQYDDGDCGVIAVEVLLAMSQQHVCSHITANALQHRRSEMANLSHASHPTSFQHVGGSYLAPSNVPHISQSLPIDAHHHDPPTQDSQSMASDLNPWRNAVQLQDLLHQGHACIGTLDGADIRMASYNINSLHDDKLPFLAWMFIKYKLDILAVQDTRIAHHQWRFTKESAAPLFPDNTLFMHSPPMPCGTGPTSHIGGVAVIVSARCCSSPNFRTDPLKCGAICGYSFATQLGRLLIISAYFPNKSPGLQGSLWHKISQALPRPTSQTPLQHLMATADAWSSLEEAHAGTFLLGDLNASIGVNASGGCHNIQA